MAMIKFMMIHSSQSWPTHKRVSFWSRAASRTEPKQNMLEVVSMLWLSELGLGEISF